MSTTVQNHTPSQHFMVKRAKQNKNLNRFINKNVMYVKKSVNYGNFGEIINKNGFKPLRRDIK